MYTIEIDQNTGRADLVDDDTGKRWHFAGGYGDMERKITQPGCARVASYLGKRHMSTGSILDALDAAHATAR
jgi:hypothetical protein